MSADVEVNLLTFRNVYEIDPKIFGGAGAKRVPPNKKWSFNFLFLSVHGHTTW